MSFRDRQAYLQALVLEYTNCELAGLFNSPRTRLFSCKKKDAEIQLMKIIV